jgi:hypothetical protein
LHAGAESVGPEVQIKRVGCRSCPELAKGAPPGSSCQSPKVCAERCCVCPDGRVRYAARVCEHGTCAGEAACSRARELGSDPCASQER